MMQLIEDSGRVCTVLIDGIQWHMGSEEYQAMASRDFHRWPYHLKKINPEPHSCARCLNRPIEFRISNKRTSTEHIRTWKPGICTDQKNTAYDMDYINGNTIATDALKIFRKCPTGSWSRAVPFYNNFNCTVGSWPEEKKIVRTEANE